MFILTLLLDEIIYIYMCVKIVKLETLVPIFLNMASRIRISKAYEYYFVSIETRQTSSFLSFSLPSFLSTLIMTHQIPEIS